MDAILNYRLEDMEDYYSLLGCSELSTVRLSFWLFAMSMIILGFVCREILKLILIWIDTNT